MKILFNFAHNYFLTAQKINTQTAYEIGGFDKVYELYYWFDENNVLQVRASKEDIHGNPFDERFIYGIILHELFEFGIISHKGISIDKIEEFDKLYNGSDPGSHPEAPYHKEHMEALAVEEMFYNHVDYNG